MASYEGHDYGSTSWEVAVLGYERKRQSPSSRCLDMAGNGNIAEDTADTADGLVAGTLYLHRCCWQRCCCLATKTMATQTCCNVSCLVMADGVGRRVPIEDMNLIWRPQLAAEVVMSLAAFDGLMKEAES